MGRVNLSYFAEQQYGLQTNAGAHDLFCERVSALLLIGDPKNWNTKDSLVDTGAIYTVFPSHIWTRLDETEEIEWLYIPGVDETLDIQMPEEYRQIGGLGGGKMKCRIGRIQLQIVDRSTYKHASPPATILAKFAEDGKLKPKARIKKPLLGLGGNAFSGCHLNVIPNGRAAWIEFQGDPVLVVPPAPGAEGDRGIAPVPVAVPTPD